MAQALTSSLFFSVELRFGAASIVIKWCVYSLCVVLLIPHSILELAGDVSHGNVMQKYLFFFCDRGK
jgi:hypothetical protein